MNTQWRPFVLRKLPSGPVKLQLESCRNVTPVSGKTLQNIHRMAGGRELKNRFILVQKCLESALRCSHHTFLLNFLKTLPSPMCVEFKISLQQNELLIRFFHEPSAVFLHVSGSHTAVMCVTLCDSLKGWAFKKKLQVLELDARNMYFVLISRASCCIHSTAKTEQDVTHPPVTVTTKFFFLIFLNLFLTIFT